MMSPSSAATRAQTTRTVVVLVLIATLLSISVIVIAGIVNPTPAKQADLRRQEGDLVATTTRHPSGTQSATTTTTTTTTRPVATLPVAPLATPVAATAGRLAPVYSVVPTTNRVIFLGIDDGIVQDPAVLAYLQQIHIPFSVFLVKPYAQHSLAFWTAIQAAGGTIEAHTITHPDLKKVSVARQRKEICGTLDTYQQLFGRRPTLFRPPYGSYNASVRAIAASCGFKAIVMWKGSTNDGRLDLQDGKLLKPGDILLMHWRTDLLQNLHVVVAACEAQGFTIARLEDYLG
jgi:peptidoglycan/xylan/chitin deacetylase (PgdA/CDA1 family)